MVKKKYGRLLALLLAFTLVFVAGCQAIGGVDFNKMLKNALKVTSSEGKQSLELQLHLNEDMMAEIPEDEAALINMISHIKLELDNVKMQDNSHASFDGSLQFGDDTSIGFAMQLSDTVAVIELEGAKQPYVLDMTGASYLEMMGLGEELAAPQLDQDSFTALGHKLLDSVGGFAIDNLPNPKNIQVNPVFEQINGTGTSLMHVKFDMNGPDIAEWLKKYVDALLNDREGLERMLTDVLEILSSSPEMKELMGEFDPFDSEELDAPTTEEMVKEASEAIVELLEELQAELDNSAGDDSESGSINELLSDKLVIKSDIYVDYKLDIRKQKFELNYTMDEDNETLAMLMLPFSGITLKTESESWNVNGTVKADEPAVTDEAVAVEELSFMEGYQVLRQFDEDSVIYDLLKNKLHIGYQSYTAYNDDYYNPPIIVPGWITIVPIRDVAMAFGATIEYDAATKTIELYDEATDTLIVTQVGSDIAVVNGKRVKWSFPTTIINGTGYVAARSLSEALGADIEWTTLYEDWKVLTIEREV